RGFVRVQVGGVGASGLRPGRVVAPRLERSVAGVDEDGDDSRAEHGSNQLGLAVGVDVADREAGVLAGRIVVPGLEGAVAAVQQDRDAALPGRDGVGPAVAVQVDELELPGAWAGAVRGAR